LEINLQGLNILEKTDLAAELETLQKSTEELISIRKQLSEKQAELDALDESDNDRSDVSAEVERLKKEVDEKEHHWNATKEVWRREFGPIVDSNSSLSTGINAANQHDIKRLQEQIASLQKQLDEVSLRRKQMVADAEEQHRRLVEQDDSIDDNKNEE
ncbi:hypothetical protein BX616_003196, partial [Lobosporangium transversale]